MGVTKKGVAEISNLIGDVDSPEYFLYLAYGTGTTVFANTQTSMGGTEVDREAATAIRVTTVHADDTLRLSATFDIASSITITEVAVFNASSGGDMLMRNVLSSSKVVVSGQLYALVVDIPVAIA